MIFLSLILNCTILSYKHNKTEKKIVIQFTENLNANRKVKHICKRQKLYISLNKTQLLKIKKLVVELEMLQIKKQKK